MRPGLAEFLQAAAARRFVYGEFDCGLWLADWYMVATGRPDPAAHLRGVGRRDVGNQVRSIARRCGLQRTLRPTSGDIALISIARGEVLGAIYSTSWTVLAERGLTVLGADRIERSIIWSIPWHS